MSKAEELAQWILSGTWHEQTDYERGQLISIESELRRLAQMETEYVSLLKAISDAVSVAQIRMSDGGLSVVNRVTTKGVQVSVHRADGDWTPLYTLNGIKKP